MNHRQPGRTRATRATAFAIMLGVLLNSFMLAGRCAATPTGKGRATMTAPATCEMANANARDAVAKRPLLFETNNGQSDAAVRFIARADHYTIFLTATEAVMAMSAAKSEDAPAAGQETPTEALRMRLLGANARPRVDGIEPVTARNNYFIGHDASRWQTSVTNFNKVNCPGVYPGINLIYYGNRRELEYDFNVAAGADPAAIRLAFTGAQRLSLNEQGDLVIETGAGQITHHKPVAYQMVNGTQQEIPCQYRLTATATGAVSVASFELGDYDHKRELVIDPVVAYSTYLGGSKDDRADAIAVDDEGNIYITGRTRSVNFPILDALQPGKTAPATDYEDIFVSKLDPSGTQLLYSTYLGGSLADYGTAIGLDEAGNIYVAGITYSPDFPLANAMRATFGGKSEGFVAKLNASGSALIYSTYVGGQDEDGLYSLVVDPACGVWVGGYTYSTDFPMFAPVQASSGGNLEGVVAKLNAQGTAFEFATYFGGSGRDFCLFCIHSDSWTSAI